MEIIREFHDGLHEVRYENGTIPNHFCQVDYPGVMHIFALWRPEFAKGKYEKNTTWHVFGDLDLDYGT